jgi:hypothetical protein
MIMKRPENDKWLDDALAETIGSKKTEPNFEKWKQGHPQAVEMLTARAARGPSASKSPLSIRIMIMKSPITKLVAAAMIIIAVAISVTILDKSVTPSYAIEQTIEANRGLWFIHLKCEPSTHGSVDEIWAQFDDNRQLTHLRMNFPDTSDGPKDVVWHEGKAEVWFKTKKRITVMREKDMLAKSKMYYESFDPKRIVEKLYQAQGSENVQIEIQESSAEGAPITITMTKKGSPNVRAVFEVDPETKLLQQEERYKLEDGEYKFLGRTRYLDYNNPADSEIFVLKPPADVFRVDQTTQEIGLAQGNLSDDEIVVEVATQFFQALIDEDYAKAGLLWGGIPPERIKTIFHVLKFVRIVSIGKVVPHSNPLTGGLSIPCEIEIEHTETGERMTETINPGIRKVHGRPDRWTIFGGI